MTFFLAGSMVHSSPPNTELFSPQLINLSWTLKESSHPDMLLRGLATQTQMHGLNLLPLVLMQRTLSALKVYGLVSTSQTGLPNCIRMERLQSCGTTLCIEIGNTPWSRPKSYEFFKLSYLCTSRKFDRLLVECI